MQRSRKKPPRNHSLTEQTDYHFTLERERELNPLQIVGEEQKSTGYSELGLQRFMLNFDSSQLDESDESGGGGEECFHVFRASISLTQRSSCNFGGKRMERDGAIRFRSVHPLDFPIRRRWGWRHAECHSAPLTLKNDCGIGCGAARLLRRRGMRPICTRPVFCPVSNTPWREIIDLGLGISNL